MLDGKIYLLLLGSECSRLRWYESIFMVPPHLDGAKLLCIGFAVP